MAPETRKAKTIEAVASENPLDSSGILKAAKDGDFITFGRLITEEKLTLLRKAKRK